MFSASSLLVIVGLVLFEIVSSIDNAVINAGVLKNMSTRARKWFLTYGLFFAVFMVRGILPFGIVWLANPSIPFLEVIHLSFTDPVRSHELIEQGAPLLLIGGGIFLVLLFLNWIFNEAKTIAFGFEKFFLAQSIWFYAAASFLLVGIIGLAENKASYLSLAAAIGSSTFFIIHGLNQKAEEAEAKMLKETSGSSDFSKLLLLLVIDAVFSIDGVVGAFAFTTSVPLILLGNGIGALVVRQITVGNIERIESLKLIKNGAMYSIGLLGCVMLLDAFKVHVPEWLSPLATLIIVGYFFWRSIDLNKRNQLITAQG